MAKVRITQIRSQIGQSERHRGTLRARLGKGPARAARGRPVLAGMLRRSSPREGGRGVVGEQLNLSNLKPARAARTQARRPRLGSGKGRTAGRGIKGQKSRAGSAQDARRLEGGQMPIYMRIGKAARLHVEGRLSGRSVPHLHAPGQCPRSRPLRSGRRGRPNRSSRRASPRHEDRRSCSVPARSRRSLVVRGTGSPRLRAKIEAAGGTAPPRAEGAQEAEAPLEACAGART